MGVYQGDEHIGPLFLLNISIRKHKTGDFPGSPVFKILCCPCRGVGFIPGQGSKIPHATQPKRRKTTKTTT